MNHTALRTVLIVALFSVTSVLQADVVNLVKNGQFTEWTGTPNNVGYLASGNGDSITNWKVVGSNSYGVVTAGTTNKAFIGGATPNFESLGNHLFVQTNTGERSVSQTITGLEVGKSYVVNFLYGTRVQNGTATLSCTLGGEELLNFKTATANQHYSVFKTFTATNESADFIFTSNTTGTDYSFNLQNVVIKEATETGWKSFSVCKDASSIIADDKYTHAVHFRASGGGNFVTNGVTFNTITGKDAVANSYISRSAGLAVNNEIVNSEFVGMKTGFFYPNSTSGQYITLDGLLPGFEYETTIYSNRYGDNSRQATVSVNGDDSLMVCANSFDGLNNTDQMSALVWQGNANSGGVLKFDFSDMSSAAYPHIHGVANRFISAPQGTILGAAFSGTNAQLSASGTSIDGTKVDTFVDSNFIADIWQARGTDTASIIYSSYKNQECAQLGANSALVLDIDSGAIVDSGAKGLEVSASIALATIAGNDTTVANGIGLGFFGDAGTDAWDNFSGLVVASDGSLYFYDNGTASQSIAYGGTWDATTFHNLTFALEYDKDDVTKAILSDISFEGSTADYSQLLGSVFSTMDNLGVMSSSVAGGKGYVNNMTATTVIVPEPSTWALIIIGVLALLGFRRKK